MCERHELLVLAKPNPRRETTLKRQVRAKHPAFSAGPIALPGILYDNRSSEAGPHEWTCPVGDY